MRRCLSDELAEPMEPEPNQESPLEPERPVFRHPQWMVGVVLIFGVMAILAGFEDPLWWLIGSPGILALAIWIYGKIKPI
jgi:uncharacterized membrane protein